MPSKIIAPYGDSLDFDCGCSFPVVDGKPVTCFDSHNPNLTINPECLQTWDDLEKYTQGVFQLELPSGRAGCEKLKPRNLEQIGALGSILRPGAAEARDEDGVSIKDHYIKRKNNLEEVEPYHPVVDEVLKDTYGCMIYQENAMKLAVEVAGFDPQEADSLRKAIGKKLPEEMSKSKKVFYEKAKLKGILNDKQIEEVFGWIEKSQRYSFNKCLAGNTIINAPSSRQKTIQELYNIITYKVDKSDTANTIRRKFAREGYIGWGLSWSGDYNLIKNKIVDIQYAGRNECFKVLLKDGSYFEATSNHKVPTTNGEKFVSDLGPGHWLYIKRRCSLDLVLVEVESVQPVGTISTFDVNMLSPYHNLCVNDGIVVSNSHAISYGLLGFISAYIKTHFPLQFYTAWLKNEETPSYKGLVREAKLFADINTYTPDLRDLEKDFYIKDGAIRFGLVNVKNVGEKDYTKLLDLNGGKNIQIIPASHIKEWPKFLFTALEEINSKSGESLILSGALDYFKLDRQRMLIEFKECGKLFKTAQKEKDYILKNLLCITSVTDILKKVRDEKATAVRKIKIQKVIDYLDDPISPLKDTVDSILFAEQNLLGVALTTHESENLASAIETHSCIDVENGCSDYAVLKVRIDAVKTYIDKNDNEMAFVEISDGSCSLKSVVFHEAWANIKHLINEGSLLFVGGKKMKSFIIERAYGTQ